ncbi:MAG: hypothetical protein ABI690_03945 [Chloroflexota bacterium]
MSEKRCTKCGETYPATAEYFRPREDARDGFRSICRDCEREANTDWRARNPERASQYVLDWRKQNPEKKKQHDADYRVRNAEKKKQSDADYRTRNSEKLRQYGADYRVRNPEKRRQGSAEWAAQNPEKVRQKSLDYRMRNPEKILIKNQRRRTRKLSLPNEYTAEDFFQAIKYFGESCAYCSVQVSECKKLYMDHYVPLTHPDCPGTVCGNIVPACPFCNSSKGNRDAVEWIRGKFPDRANAISEKITAFLMVDGAVFRSNE